ncbi:hypothetical protein C8Q77DRAFT_791736 [Trametes polyzona]|nr:hypothetical protein C8Q77DRAFT_791736 [Trametes polyzona]
MTMQPFHLNIYRKGPCATTGCRTVGTLRLGTAHACRRSSSSDLPAVLCCPSFLRLVNCLRAVPRPGMADEHESYQVVTFATSRTTAVMKEPPSTPVQRLQPFSRLPQIPSRCSHRSRLHHRLCDHLSSWGLRRRPLWLPVTHSLSRALQSHAGAPTHCHTGGNLPSQTSGVRPANSAPTAVCAARTPVPARCERPPDSVGSEFTNRTGTDPHCGRSH